MFNLCSPPPKKNYPFFDPRDAFGFDPQPLFEAVGERTKKHDFPHLIHISCPSIISHLFKKKTCRKKIPENKKDFVPCVLGNSKYTFVFPVPLQTVHFETNKIHAPNDGRRRWSGTSGRKRFPGSDPGALRCLPEFFHQLRWPRPQDGLAWLLGSLMGSPGNRGPMIPSTDL